MEGVAFALRDALEVFLENGVRPRLAIASGGGASSPLWRQILADVLETPLHPTATSEQAAFGAALLAGVGVGVYPSVQEACRRTIKLTEPTEPSAQKEQYREAYQRFRLLYPSLRGLF